MRGADAVAPRLVRAVPAIALSRRALPYAEWLLIGLAAPALLVGGRFAPLGLVPLLVAWIVRRRLTGRWSVPSPLHGPALVLLVVLLIALIPSLRLEYSLPKLGGILLGLAVLYACLNTCRTQSALAWAGWLLLGAGLVLAIVGVFYMSEPQSKLFGRDLYALLPRFDRRIQSSTIMIWGINPNEVGGVIALFAPLAVVLAVSSADQRLRRLALAAAVLLLGALIFTQSRAAIVGVGLALIVGAVWRGGRRRRLGALTALAIGSTLALVVVGPSRLPAVGRGFVERAGTVLGRTELWQRAAAMIVDMPLTGIGLNTFPLVVVNFYPGSVSPDYYDPTAAVPHAHNLYLQTTLDLGLIGFGAFAVIVAYAVHGGLVAAGRGPLNPLAVGLLLGLLAHALYSLNDAVALGAKPSPALWAVLGLLTALGALASPERPSPSGRARALRLAVLGLALALLAVPLLAPAALNLALLRLHGSALGPPGPASVEAELGLARTFAWGPYPARIRAAEAAVARARGDTAAEIAALEQATALGPWDPSLTVLLDEARVLANLPEAVSARGATPVVEVLIRRGRAAPPPVALELFRRAQEVAPRDARAYLGAADALSGLERPDEAAAMLARAIRLRGDDPWRAALASRLVQVTTPLPSTERVTAPFYRDDAVLLERAAALLRGRRDPEGAIFAERLYDLAPPSRPS